MTKNTWRSVRGWFPAALTGFALAGASLGTTFTFAGDLVVRTYESVDGQKIGSISLPFQEKVADRGVVSHVVLLDTSASQIGEHRLMATSVLANFLNSLPTGDRVSVLAYDVRTAPLTAGWTTPKDAQTQSEVSLKTRFPAGSSNLKSALLAAKEQLAGEQNGSILIIGDGMSSAHYFQPAELKELTGGLRDVKIPVHSFAVGSKTDVRLMGILGEETGGFVMQDEWTNSNSQTQEVGALLANATHVGVFYPESVRVSEADVELLPNRPLPMRSDRETVYLVGGDIKEGAKISVTGAVGGVQQTITFEIPEIKRDFGNTFLTNFWRDAKATDGVAIGMAGDWMVNLAHQSFEDQITLISAEGERALANGDLTQAENIAAVLKNVDPLNTHADILADKAQAGAMLVAQLPGTGAFGGPDIDDDVPSIPAPETPVPAGLADREFPAGNDNIINYQAMVQAKGQKLQREVEMQIEQAYEFVENSMGAQAEGVLDRARATIKSATDVPAELANNLLRRVESIRRDVKNRREMYDARAQEAQRLRAELEVTTLLIDYATERDLQLEQMVDRIRTLMVDAYRGNPQAFEDAEAQARIVLSDFPGSAIGAATVTLTEAAGQVDKASRLRYLRADKLLETLHQVELSHVPFPDEPPLNYPPAEVWWALTKMRQKWKSVDLKLDSENEKKIYDVLEQQTSVEFPGTPLKDAISFLATQHNIPIILDTKALEDESVSDDLEINLVISGIKFRNALKLMLEKVAGDAELTYIIEDEVMKITTVTKANAEMQTRVYPVADLVIPVQPMGGGMGGMGMGGGMGGMGMGGGMGGMGMGGGMGGMGMGGMGMGGMGMMQSIPATPLSGGPSQLKSAVEAAKKKPTL
ncbi:VWA domain-containing protein [Planctomicrobium sp. SH668]|uniref:VWA domain-containing protein n=1 Tax=Planctomicrobium sp. SH668 TaxID=3448126 RepID=UPI003F5B07B2